MRIEIHADGSTKSNPGTAGWGAIIVIENDWTNSETIRQKGYVKSTNNRMELLGIMTPLKEIIDTAEYAGADIHLYSDSKYVVNAGSEWIKSWKKRNWRSAAGSPIANSDLMKEFDNLITIAKPTFHWVKGHAGHAYNERCDILAKDATNLSDLEIDKGFEDSIKEDL